MFELILTHPFQTLVLSATALMLVYMAVSILSLVYHAYKYEIKKAVRVLLNLFYNSADPIKLILAVAFLYSLIVYAGWLQPEHHH